MVELHDLDGGQVLRGLGLRAGLVAGNQQQGGVHDGGARQHSAHENVVAGAVDERDVALQAVLALAALALARGVDLLLALVGPVACRARALGVVALVDLGVGVAELDGDVALELVLEADRLHARDGLDDGGLAVGDVANGADVDGGLARDDLGRQRGEGAEVDCAGFGLLTAICYYGFFLCLCFCICRSARQSQGTYGSSGRSTCTGASLGFFSADLGFVSSSSSFSDSLSTSLTSRCSCSDSESILGGRMW